MPTLTESMREILNRMKESEADIFEVKEEVDEEDEDINEEKADKDYDGDGEVESKEEEWKGSRDKAIKKTVQEEYEELDWDDMDPNWLEEMAPRVVNLHNEGMNVNQISREMSLHPSDVREFLNMMGVATTNESNKKSIDPSDYWKNQLNALYQNYEQLAGINEKWAGDYETPKSERGKYKGKTQAELKKMLSNLKKSGPHKRGSSEFEKMKELEFALRAKTGWNRVPK